MKEDLKKKACQKYICTTAILETSFFFHKKKKVLFSAVNIFFTIRCFSQLCLQMQWFARQGMLSHSLTFGQTCKCALQIVLALHGNGEQRWDPVRAGTCAVANTLITVSIQPLSFVLVNKPKSGRFLFFFPWHFCSSKQCVVVCTVHSPVHGQAAAPRLMLSAVPSQVNYEALCCSLQ